MGGGGKGWEKSSNTRRVEAPGSFLSLRTQKSGSAQEKGLTVKLLGPRDRGGLRAELVWGTAGVTGAVGREMKPAASSALPPSASLEETGPLSAPAARREAVRNAHTARSRHLTSTKQMVGFYNYGAAVKSWRAGGLWRRARPDRCWWSTVSGACPPAGKATVWREERSASVPPRAASRKPSTRHRSYPRAWAWACTQAWTLGFQMGKGRRQRAAGACKEVFPMEDLV
ncbi:uncharacterized protein LOC143650994 [Tamandua tetradactyla]|uniref:uncharacterized protein LOC143650994 n=1 Tax=Tamandua tetradactyla TaxID=48850 RepID=UPI0040541194